MHPVLAHALVVFVLGVRVFVLVIQAIYPLVIPLVVLASADQVELIRVVALVNQPRVRFSHPVTKKIRVVHIQRRQVVINQHFLGGYRVHTKLHDLPRGADLEVENLDRRGNALLNDIFFAGTLFENFDVWVVVDVLDALCGQPGDRANARFLELFHVRLDVPGRVHQGVFQPVVQSEKTALAVLVLFHHVIVRDVRFLLCLFFVFRAYRVKCDDLVTGEEHAQHGR